MSAYTWNDRGIPEKCESYDNEAYHAMKLSNVNSGFVWVYGDYSLKPFKMSAGEEIKVELEWNFSNQAHSPDWSIVAYGDGKKGSLSLKHSKGLKSN